MWGKFIVHRLVDRNGSVVHTRVGIFKEQSPWGAGPTQTQTIGSLPVIKWVADDVRISNLIG